MSNEDISALYDYITEYIKSPIFRTEIKDFVDDNCGTFFGEDENSFQQYGLHKEFKQLIENLLDKMLSEIGATQEQFLLAAKMGLEQPEDKKFYEQLIACDNYVYFKNMMIKRNLQLEEQALQLMEEQNKLKGKKEEFKVTPEWKELQRIREETELECAIQMSLALEEEIKKLRELEDEDLRKAIELSKLSLNSGKEEETQISLLDASTLVNKNKNVEGNVKKTPVTDLIKNVPKTTPPQNKNITIPPKDTKKADVKIISKNDKNIDIAFYGASGADSKISTDDKKNNKNYVDVTIDKTEKLQFAPTQSSMKASTSSSSNQNLEPAATNFLNDVKVSESINIQPLEPTVPRNLNQIKTKTYTGDRSFLFQSEKVDYSDIKLKVDETKQTTKEIMSDIKTGHDELTQKLEDLQKEKQEKLKEYRDMLLKMKKEKRHTEKDKDDPFEIDESKLSDEVKKRLQMRKQLAEQLKSSKI